MDSNVCAAIWPVVLQTYSSIIYFTVVVLFCMALCLHFQLRHTFHPFFSVLFAEAMFMYATCDFCLVAIKIFRSLEISELTIAKILYQIYDYAYAMIIPLQLCCLIERFAATLFIRTYEYNRKWHLLFLSQPFCFAFIFALNNFIRTAVENETLAFIFLSYYIVQITGTLALFYINRHMILKYTGQGEQLSMRYQLAENIRTIRVFFPMITCDSLISLFDLVYYYLRFDYVFEPERCAQDHLYLRLYLVVVGIGSAIEVTGAAFVNLMYPGVKIPCNRKKNAGSLSVMNVLGSDLIMQQKDRNHFVELNKYWI